MHVDGLVRQRRDARAGLLDRLGLEAAAFCGHSYGAWLALSYALHRANAERLMPHVTAAVLPGASHHSLPAAKPDRLNQELADFLG